MVGPLSVTFRVIYMVKIENVIVALLKSKLYRRCSDYLFNRRKKNVEDIIFDSLNNYYKNIKVTTEINPTKFLGTKLNYADGIYKTMVYMKTIKLPINWSSKGAKRHK